MIKLPEVVLLRLMSRTKSAAGTGPALPIEAAEDMIVVDAPGRASAERSAEASA